MNKESWKVPVPYGRNGKNNWI